MLRGKFVVYAVFVSSWLAFVCTWAVPQKRTLTVAGHPGYIPVVEMGGRSYIEIEALVRVTNGSLSFKGPQMVLTLPSAGLEAQVGAAAASQPVVTGFTREFLKASIEQMSAIREWRSTLTNAVQKGFPITEDWMTGFSSQAEQNLRLVSVAASSEADRSAMRLLTNEFNNMKALSDRFLAANRSRTYIPTDALNNDPLDQRILNCGHALAAMAANNQFVDDASCH